ncbi:MAG: phosphomannomutase/phosphoglucomutase [Pseudomonadales bacterium]
MASPAVQSKTQLDPDIFRAYDIRGVVETSLTPTAVYWIGRAFAAEALSQGQRSAVVAGDGRNSTPSLCRSLAKGLNEGGINVIDIGMVPTPLLYYATHRIDEPELAGTQSPVGTGIMITGSHNPPEYNGLKMMIGGTTLAGEAIQRLRQRVADKNLSDGVGNYRETKIIEEYVSAVRDDIRLCRSLKVVVDCGNGVAGIVAPDLLTILGCDVVPLYADVDGNFPNHHPDPAEPANLLDLISAVDEQGADLGIAFDGDGDRLGLVSNTGTIIWPDRILMLFARDILSRNRGAEIVFDVKCSNRLTSLITDLGGSALMWKTGHSHIKAKLKETGALLGGEFSGHFCFVERWFGFDDALYSAARLLELLSAETRTVEDIFLDFPPAVSTPELKIPTTEKKKFDVIQALSRSRYFDGGEIATIDGIRVDYDEGWGLIRASNTSPVLSLRFEAESTEALVRIKNTFQTAITHIDPELTIP